MSVPSPDTPKNRKPVEDFAELVTFLEEGCKPPEDWRIGTEHEKFPFYRSDLSSVPYEGENGIRALLEGMQAEVPPEYEALKRRYYEELVRQ